MKDKLLELGIDVAPPSIGNDGLPDNAHEWVMFCLENGVPWHFEDVASGNDLLTWLDSNTDQNVWTDLVLGMNYDLEVCEKALLQMLRHPDCSQLVAIAALQHTHAELYFGDKASEPRSLMHTILSIITERDAKNDFQVADMLDPGEVDRWELFDTLEERAKVAAPYFPLPKNLMQSEEGSEKFRRPYVIEESSIYKVTVGSFVR